MEKSESIVNIIKALSKAQSEFKPVAKSGKNPHYKSEYSTLDDMKEATMPALKENGLTLNFFPQSENGVNYMGACLMHVSGEYLFSKYVVAPEKTGMQGMGSAWTYLKRYIWGSIFSLYDDTNDDAMEENTTKKEPQKRSLLSQPLTSTQLKFLNVLLEKRGLDMHHVLEELNIPTLEHVTQDKLTDFVEMIKKQWKVVK